MNELIKPMLAAKPEDYGDAFKQALRFPLLASPKLDGIRASVQNGNLYSRSLKHIPNHAMQFLWGCQDIDGVDGEIIVGPATAENVFNRTTSQVMRKDGGIQDATFHIFDDISGASFDYVSRLANAMHLITGRAQVALVQQTLIADWEALLEYETRQLEAGYEGVMLRDPHGTYKQGRSTLKELGLVAIKRFSTSEAKILGTFEALENRNPQTINELGKKKRSSHAANKIGKDTLGGFRVQDLSTGVEFDIGTGRGLTEELRKELWLARKKQIGRILTYKYQEVGSKDAPRQPIFLGFRDRRDL